MMSTWTERWNRLWFVPGTALDLAAARVILALHALWILLSRDLPAMSGLPEVFYAGVTDATRMRYLLVEGHTELEAGLQWVAIASLVAACCGWWARASCLLAGLLLYRLAPLETWIWTSEPYERGLTVSVLGLIVLSAAPCGDALRLGRRAPASSVMRDATDYGWALRLVQLFLAQVYLFSGWAKLRAVGWDWASAESLRHWLLVFQQQDQVAVHRVLGSWMAERPWACVGAGVLGLGLDLGFVFAVVSSRARRVLLPLALLFHAGVLFAMNIAYLGVPQLLVFVNWSSLAERLRPSGVAPHQLGQAPVSPS